MTRNMGTVDRSLRLLVVAAIAALYVTDRINGPLAIVLGIIAVVFFATSALGFCPLYTLFGFSTRSDAQAAVSKPQS